jgi:CHAT domain-containing protein
MNENLIFLVLIFLARFLLITFSTLLIFEQTGVSLAPRQLNPSDSIEIASSLAPDSLSVTQIKRIAAEHQATLVQYSILEDNQNHSKLYIWVIKPTGEIELRQTHLSQSLSQLVVKLRQSLEHESQEDWQKLLQQLHQILIKPIAAFLPNQPEERVIFIPQGSLFLVPFAALIDEQGTALIEHHTLSTVPAIQVLELTQQRLQTIQGKAENILVFGSIYSQSELLEVAKIFNTEALIENQATKASILAKMSQARIIHTSANQIKINENNNYLMGLVFNSQTTKTPEILTIQDIQNSTLNAELVVLSGDNTGIGTITSDGVMGLSRAFLVAGTPSIIVSLWNVPEQPTAELMIEFYQQFRQNSDKAQALRQAMLATMKNYPHPRNWAGFILIGQAE